MPPSSFGYHIYPIESASTACVQNTSKYTPPTTPDSSQQSVYTAAALEPLPIFGMLATRFIWCATGLKIDRGSSGDSDTRCGTVDDL